MKATTRKILGIAKRRGFWLRCFLGAIGPMAFFAVLPSRASLAQGIVDCVYPGRVSVSRVQGRVFDPFGTVVPGAVITLVNEHNVTLQTTTDNQGRFHFATSPGKYRFKAEIQMFQKSQTELSVGEDLAGLIYPSDLHVILGLSGSYCAWVTTSQREFRQIISSNEKRLKESAQNNATQK
jgi:hypothetical protein